MYSKLWPVVLHFALSCLLALSAFTDDELASAEDLRRFKTAVWANAEEVAEDINFVNASKNPYPFNNKGYNVDIDWTSNCYLVFKDEQQDTYDMITAREKPEGDYGVFKSHTGPCGSCSSLQDLSVYIEKRDLKTPVKNCAMIPFRERKWNCLKNLGFTDRCTWIWFWNSLNTGLSMNSGGCRRTCLWHIRTPNNQPFGTHNPCRPMPHHLDMVDDDESDLIEDEPDVPPSSVLLPRVTNAKKKGKDALDDLENNHLIAMVSFKGGPGSSSRKQKHTGFCRNTINMGPACETIQYMPGPNRLNPCLQCDECKSGPMFKKLAGRVRRNSGIKSAIDRPGVPKLDHHYYTGYTETDPAEKWPEVMKPAVKSVRKKEL